MKGGFSRLYCCYGNLLCHKKDYNIFTNNWAVFFDTMIAALSDKEWSGTTHFEPP